MKNETIGIIGSGIVGQTLAGGFIRHGYQVMIGSRNPGKLDEWKKSSGLDVQTGTFGETAAFGNILVLAVKGSAALEALSLINEDDIRNKTIIDATNPISEEAPENGVIKFFTSQNSSLMEELQQKFPFASFVKAFNSIGASFMVNPDFGKQKPTMFICGNSDDAKQEVTGILDAFGFEAEDMGEAEAARAIEPLCMLWCIPGIRDNSWNHAFKLLKP
jgi:8-hydroxy-5-deazaflavin:NADPH oxidoreductase